MNILLPFDTETTGLHFKNRPLADPSQPRLVQVSALQIEEGSNRVIQSLSLIVSPNGWEIPLEAQQVHGISTEFATEFGQPEKQVLDAFLSMWNDQGTLIAHNSQFDKDVISTAIARHYGACQLLDMWVAAPHYCTMQAAKPIVQARNVRGALKYPKLTEAYEFFFEKELDRAHSANADAVGAFEIYLALKEISE